MQRLSSLILWLLSREEGEEEEEEEEEEDDGQNADIMYILYFSHLISLKVNSTSN